ncbi:SDR family NAD(P)-dependent oxidoreductase [Dyadobacter sp. CY312]|uniref:SDR family NAD(P)-dependent oxidoreductase n=1 Tax=Dyadobacter sp. CY312 TaxID=2907303 RepID=UPI001F320687|nr:SDR family oxidoreductase [Dyadobacter sp. CY312]MCE7041507.1 SDR family oxidoreductase [Dyadobacter sp. CY312]
MIAEKFNLKGKTALVTGSSQGIGKGIALALAEYGADIIIHYRSEKDEADQVAEEIRTLGSRVWLIQSDLSENAAVPNMVDRLQQMVKTIDILVINASVQLPATWEDTKEDEIDIQFNTNFKSTFLLIQLIAPQMIASGWGRILTIGSVQQIKPHPNMLIYAATKSAVLNLVQNMAMQLADKGITVNNLAPGVIGTARIEEEVPESEERINKRMETPSGKIGNTEDCAAMALLLCSEAGNFITGQNIFVDGGMSL